MVAGAGGGRVETETRDKNQRECGNCATRDVVWGQAPSLLSTISIALQIIAPTWAFYKDEAERRMCT